MRLNKAVMSQADLRQSHSVIVLCQCRSLCTGALTLVSIVCVCLRNGAITQASVYSMPTTSKLDIYCLVLWNSYTYLWFLASLFPIYIFTASQLLKHDTNPGIYLLDYLLPSQQLYSIPICVCLHESCERP